MTQLQNDLDAIDTVARRMTAGAPASDLRPSVLAGLEPRRPGRAIWWLAPAAAAAAVALVIGAPMLRRMMTPESAAPIAASTPRIETAAVPAGAPTLDETTARDARGIDRPAVRALSPAQVAWRLRAIPALDAIEALSFTTIQPDVLSIPQLEVKPLVTAPIDTGAGDGGSR